MSDLGHYIRVRYGLAPEEPTTTQLAQIEAEIRQFGTVQNRDPSEAELRDIVARICPTTGKWKYGSDVNLELRRQLALLRAQAKK